MAPDCPEIRREDVIYRTAKGAFFAHYHSTTKLPKGKPLVDDAAHELSPQEVVDWIAKHNAMVLDPSDLPMPPEA